MPLVDRMDRRQFATHVTLGACALTAGVSSTSIADAKDEKPAADLPAEKKGEEPEPKPEPPPEVFLLSYLIRKYPSDRFDEAALRGIFRDVLGDVARGSVLSSFPLRSSDEPAFVFTAYRAEPRLER